MFMPRQEGPPHVMDEIPRTYYPGRGWLTDQEAYPTDMYGNVKVPEIPKDIFNRAPRYGGGLGIPGAPGNSGVFNLPYNPANDFGGFMNLPYIPGSDMGGVQLLAGGFRPAAYGAIPGGQSPYRYGPYLPFRGEEKKEEQTSFVPIPRV